MTWRCDSRRDLFIRIWYLFKITRWRCLPIWIQVIQVPAPDFVGKKKFVSKSANCCHILDFTIWIRIDGKKFLFKTIPRGFFS